MRQWVSQCGSLPHCLQERGQMSTSRGSPRPFLRVCWLVEGALNVVTRYCDAGFDVNKVGDARVGFVGESCKATSSSNTDGSGSGTSSSSSSGGAGAAPRGGSSTAPAVAAAVARSAVRSVPGLLTFRSKCSKF